jgi:prolyl-tRNA synthetase
VTAIAILGLGEAGGTIAADLRAAGVAVRGYDPLPGRHEAATPEEAVAGADAVLVLTTAAEAVTAARSVLDALSPGQLYADANTSGAALKQELAALVEPTGASFADVALMAPVPGKGLRTPAGASGPGADRFAELFGALGMPVTVVPGPPGAAATRKLLRSVAWKGVAGVVVEALEAARAAGVEDWMRGELAALFAEADVDRFEQGSRIHAVRRAHELADVAELLHELGVEPRLAEAARAQLEAFATLRRLSSARPRGGPPPRSRGPGPPRRLPRRSTSTKESTMSSSTLPAQASDFPAWYGEVVRRPELAENSAVRGAMVIRPYGYAIWEAIQRELDARIKATGHENVYFPLFVPVSVLAQEGALVEGFAPEVAVVTEAGGKPLEEPLAVRPTSEALIWSTYARWVQSYRDLPLLYNQWANVVRWELRPRLFLRTTEFLWQEGHTAHETEAEALAEALTILHDVYADTIENVLAIPVLRGRKSESERFPGAVDTYTLEALMRDGKALQAATSHYLGQGFARTFGVRFAGRDGGEQIPYATSWGATTRLVGGVVMTHGDDRGLRLPPRLAPHQVVVVPIGAVAEPTAAVAAALRAAGVRVRIDDRAERRPGYKFHEWELKGVPLRLEVGERELAAGVATLVRRDTGAREQVRLADVPARVEALLDEVQAALFREALEQRERRTLREPDGYDALVAHLRDVGGFVHAPWCGRVECEARVKAETSATIRCLPLDGSAAGSCVCCGRKAVAEAVWAQAY